MWPFSLAEVMTDWRVWLCACIIGLVISRLLFGPGWWIAPNWQRAATALVFAASIPLMFLVTLWLLT